MEIVENENNKQDGDRSTGEKSISHLEIVTALKVV